MIGLKQRRLCTCIMSSVFAVLLVFFIVNILMVAVENKYIYSDLRNLSSRQAVLVLGTSVYMKTVSPVLKERLDTAIEVYREKKASKFIVSGDHGQKYYDEVNTMRDYLIAQGIPQKDIFMDHAGFSTYDSLYRARDVFGTKSIVIATQRFHLPRALYIAHALGIDAVGVETQDSLSWPIMIRNAIREPLARAKAVFDVWVGAKPTYLGPKISLDGDGGSTKD